MPDVVAIVVNGRAYTGWQSVEIARSIENISGTFTMAVFDQWADFPGGWPLREGDVCSVSVNGSPLITGSIDDRRQTIGKGTHSVEVSGRDVTELLVDCEVDLGKWEWKNLPVLQFMQLVGAQFGIPIQLGELSFIDSAPREKISVNPGDKAFSVIDRIARFEGLLPVSNGLGGVDLITPGASTAPAAIVEGVDILSGESEFSTANRFSRYRVIGQSPRSLRSKAQREIQADSYDADVEDVRRTRLIVAEEATTQAAAQRRADWEATVAAARSDSCSVTVQGWSPKLVPTYIWTPGDLVQIQSPKLGVAGQMLISAVSLKRARNGGTTTQLTLMRPDAFSKNPVPEDIWKK